MTDPTQSRLPWLYEGIWGFLTSVFCVPREAPQLPSVEQESVVSRKPSPGFIRYLKFQFWLVIVAALLASLIVSISIIIAAQNGWILLGTFAVVLVIFFFAMIGYLAIHLRYDTTWYVFSDRSMRLRRGIWVIRESTITFENIQNVKVTQGPLERFFGIANVVVETAGGGGASAEPGAGLSMHAGLIEGVSDAAQIRDSILNRVRNNTTTGLGDENAPSSERRHAWSARHLAVMREIRDLAKQACDPG